MKKLFYIISVAMRCGRLAGTQERKCIYIDIFSCLSANFLTPHRRCIAHKIGPIEKIPGNGRFWRRIIGYFCSEKLSKNLLQSLLLHVTPICKCFVQNMYTQKMRCTVNVRCWVGIMVATYVAICRTL